MVFLSLIICLIIQRLANIGGWPKKEYFELLLKKIHPWLIKRNVWVALATLIFVVLLVLCIIISLIEGRVLGLLHLLLMIFILFCCIDARNFRPQLADYFAALSEKNSLKAINLANKFTGTPPHEEQNLMRLVSNAIILKSFELFFAPLFWFALCDVYGLSTYYLIVTLRKVALKVDANFFSLVQTSTKVENILNWAPMRLLMFTFALFGNFKDTFEYAYKKARSKSCDLQDLLLNTALMALNANLVNDSKTKVKENEEALVLINRSLMLWVAVIALLTLVSWMV